MSCAACGRSVTPETPRIVLSISALSLSSVSANSSIACSASSPDSVSGLPSARRSSRKVSVAVRMSSPA